MKPRDNGIREAKSMIGEGNSPNRITPTKPIMMTAAAGGLNGTLTGSGDFPKYMTLMTLA